MMDSTLLDTLFYICKVGSGFKSECTKDVSLTDEQCQLLYRLSTQNGILAFAFHALTTNYDLRQISRKLRLQWALNAENVEKRYINQRQRAIEFSDRLKEHGIGLNVLKGFAISRYYPTPEYRECGDLDCFLTFETESSNSKSKSAYEAGNCIAEELGANVERDYYKHSTIKFKGLIIENHAFCTAIRGSRKRKAFERHLQNLIATNPSTHIDNSNLIQPSSDFNALFLTAHSFEHFLTEGIKLRHILDWALLLKAEQNNIDWKEFYKWTDKMSMTIFADAVTAISVNYLGLEVTNPEIHTTSPYAELILKDTLYYSDSIHNKGYSAWKERWHLVKSRFSNTWKYHKIYRKSITVELLKRVVGFIFERDPKL